VEVVPDERSAGTYINDHLAGSAYAIDLVEFIRDTYEEQELGRFAAWLLTEIEADREVLQGLRERVGAGSSKVKEATAWLGHKVSRLKLGHTRNEGLGLFEALEFLEIGIHGKLELWRAFAVVAPGNPQLSGVDFAHLASRAEKQREEVESRRLQVAQFIFGVDTAQRGIWSRDVSSAAMRDESREPHWEPCAANDRLGDRCGSSLCAGPRPGAVYENTRNVIPIRVGKRVKTRAAYEPTYSLTTSAIGIL
jgi:hypothetical protein